MPVQPRFGAYARYDLDCQVFNRERRHSQLDRRSLWSYLSRMSKHGQRYLAPTYPYGIYGVNVCLSCPFLIPVTELSMFIH